MTTRTSTFTRRLWAAALLVAACAASAPAQEGQMTQPDKRVDKRKLTTIQTAAVDAGQTKNAVEVRYLNLPWGAQTFNYIESGTDVRNQGYYAGRTWPIAHLKLAAPATYQGKPLAPGDYVIFITPANQTEKKGMTLSIASFTPGEGGTFLKAGNVFVDTPKDAIVVAAKPVTFAKGAPLVDHLVIETARTGQDVALKIHYGDRTLTEKLGLK
jgi:hypothetical protein